MSNIVYLNLCGKGQFCIDCGVEGQGGFLCDDCMAKLDQEREGHQEAEGCNGPSWHGPRDGDYHYVDLATIPDEHYFPSPEQWREAHPGREIRPEPVFGNDEIPF